MSNSVVADKSLDFRMYSNQIRFLTEEHRFPAFIGGIGSGKTTAGAIRALVESAKRPNALGLVTAPTYVMMKDATARTLLEVLGPSVRHHNKSDGDIFLVNGSQIMLRSADKPDRLRGPNCHWAWIDEAAMCPNGTLEIVMGRLRADGTAGPCWLTSTPKGHNWLYQKRHLLRIIKATTEQNIFLSRTFVQGLRESYVGDFAAQELDAEFVRFEGQIYEEFSYDRHVKDTDEELSKGRRFVEFWGAADEGYINPQVFLILGLDDDGGVHVFREFYKRKIRTSVAARTAKAMARDFGHWWRSWDPEDDTTVTGDVDVWYVDPSAAALSAEMAEDEVDDDGHVLDGVPVRSANNSVLKGIQCVKSYMVGENKYGPMLTIDPSCINTITEAEQYAWKTKQEGRDMKEGPREEPIKSNDHAMDSLRYGLMSHLGGLQGSIMV